MHSDLLGHPALPGPGADVFLSGQQPCRESAQLRIVCSISKIQRLPFKQQIRTFIIVMLLLCSQ